MYALKFTFLIFFVLYVGVKGDDDDDDERYYWRDYRDGPVPKDALPGGINENGKTTYIGQVLHRDQLIPAKIDPSKNIVTYEWGYNEFVTNKNVKVLCTKHPENFEWLNTGNGLIHNISPNLLVEGGYEANTLGIYIGRKQIGNELALGKVISGTSQTTLNTTKNGKGTQHAEFQILAYNPHKSTSNQPVYDMDQRIMSNGTCNQHAITINFYS